LPDPLHAPWTEDGGPWRRPLKTPQDEGFSAGTRSGEMDEGDKFASTDVKADAVQRDDTAVCLDDLGHLHGHLAGAGADICPQCGTNIEPL
jgi:hypothetical protein